jgi:hypothetical protein
MAVDGVPPKLTCRHRHRRLLPAATVSGVSPRDAATTERVVFSVYCIHMWSFFSMNCAGWSLLSKIQYAWWLDKKNLINWCGECKWFSMISCISGRTWLPLQPGTLPGGRPSNKSRAISFQIDSFFSPASRSFFGWARRFLFVANNSLFKQILVQVF